MSYTVAVCGKGGTGKTTFTALFIQQLLKAHQDKSVLAVDADPNANLDQALGVRSEESIVGIVDEISKNPSTIPSGTTKDRYLQYRLQEAVVEGKGFDLLVMGRPEGPGCYCFVNNLLRTLIDKLSKGYDYLVIDNEAGMEHLSRRTTRKIDTLFVVSDYSIVGLRSAQRILELVKELDIQVKQKRLVINRAPENAGALKKEIEKIAIPLAGVIPHDEQVMAISVKNADLSALSEKSKAAQAVRKIYEGEAYAA
ncbi:MAG: AAA family ATPase [Candidatus Omnitrophota bacterium]